MTGLRPRQIKAIEDVRAAYRADTNGAIISSPIIGSHSLAAVFRVSPWGVSAGTRRSANMRKHERHAEGFLFEVVMAKKPFVGPLPKCSIDGCEKISRYITSQLCGAHDMRIRRYGDPNYVTSNEQFRKNCRTAAVAYKSAKDSTYKKLHSKHEHRVIAEQMIGRPLVRGDVVHHIDGNKHNNSPDNLQVMTQADHLRIHHAESVAARKAKGGYARKKTNGI